MNQETLEGLKRVFVTATAGPIIVAYLVIMILTRASLVEAVVVLVNFIPAFVPAAVYFYWVNHPKAVPVCGIILVALTAPPWLLLAAGNLQHFYGGTLFLLTLVTATVGSWISRRPASAPAMD